MQKLKFNPTNHRNPCPICQDSSGDCRTTQDNLILCHSFIDFDSGIAGYKWRGASSNGVWGIHVRDDGKQFDKQQYERYLAQKEAIERNKKQFLADNALDADGRDKAIRKLARHLGLSDRHREDLKNRGLSDRAIEAGLFFSIDPWIRFNLNLPDNLPGIHYKGDRFATKNTGYACPIYDKQGRAVGWQLRVEGATKGNKYKWAKSNFSSHLPNSELPITIIKPDVHEDKTGRNSNFKFELTQPSAFRTLYLSEGILKPAIASHRHDLAVCGAAGGHFKGSPEQLASIVSDYGELAIAPDGGDVINPQVMSRWSQQINFLKRFNKPIKILWWGQVKKSDGDIDEIELETFSNAERLTPTQFFDLAKKQQYIQQQWSNWRNYKKFTTQFKIEKKFIEYGLPQTNTITFIKSGLGTGKTTETIKHLHQFQKYGIIGLGYRNTLLLQFNQKALELGFYHLQSDKNLREFSLDNPEIKVTNCIDSLIYYVREQFDGKIVIIDEIISVLKHFLFSSTIKQFSKVKELFTEMVNRCDRLICLDGFMTDWAVKFFKELCPTKQIITIENIYQGDKARVYLLEGTIDVDERVRVNDKTPWLEKLLNSDRPAICSDSQIFCEAIENLLLEQGRRGIRVDSKTVSNEEVKEFFTAPDRYIELNNPEYLIYSPSAESGLDIPTQNYFDSHFAFFFGQLDIDSTIQMLGRIRDLNVPKYVWCKKFIVPTDTLRRPSNVESIQADRARSILSELNLIIQNTPDLSKEQISSRIQQIYQDNLDPYTIAADTIAAIHNHEFSNYRECLKRQLIDSGYPLETVTLERSDEAVAIARDEKEAKTEVKQQNSKDIYNASDKYIGVMQANLSFDADWETRSSIIKAQLVDRLPGINHDPLWSPKFIKLIKYDRPNLINQTKLYYLLENLELAKQLAREKYNGIFNRGSIAAPWKLRQDYLKVKALRDIGLYDFIQTAIDNRGFTYTADSPEVKAIIKKCRQKKNRDLLGTPLKDPIKLVNKLLRSVSIQTKAKKLKRQGKTIWVYLIDQKHLLSEERLAILQAIQLKYENQTNSNDQPLEWVINDRNSGQNSPLKESLQKMAETTKVQGFDAVADSPDIYINNSTICHPQNNHQVQANLLNEPSNTKQLRNPGDTEYGKVFDTPEAIADLAWMLDRIEDSYGLAELQTVPEFTRSRLNRACRLLSLQQQQKIRQWVNENHQRRRTAVQGGGNDSYILLLDNNRCHTPILVQSSPKRASTSR